MGHIAHLRARWRCRIVRAAAAVTLTLGGAFLIAGYIPAEEFLRCIVP